MRKFSWALKSHESNGSPGCLNSSCPGQFPVHCTQGTRPLVGVIVVVNFLFQVIFLFLLFLGMVMYANEVETKGK